MLIGLEFSFLATEELCVSDLAVPLGMIESAVSHQLRNLRAMRLVSYRKQGQNVFYRFTTIIYFIFIRL